MEVMRNKSKFERMRRGYNKVPDKINQVDLSARAYALFHYLISFHEDINPGKTFVAKKFGSTRQTIAKQYEELVMAGIIKVYSKGGLNRVTKYEFCPLDQWVINKGTDDDYNS
jgi:hypothetical protein